MMTFSIILWILEVMKSMLDLEAMKNPMDNTMNNNHNFHRILIFIYVLVHYYHNPKDTNVIHNLG
jgi:hypothetical protein